MFRALPLLPAANSNRPCTFIAAILAASFAKKTLASPSRLSGWVHRVRDHGGLLFIDLRDHYGLTQAVADPHSPAFKEAERLKPEWVVRIDGEVVARTPETVNPNLPTGGVEVRIKTIEVLSEAKELPLPVFGEPDYPEDTRLRYRFLDLRRESLHANIMKRQDIIWSLRQRMREAGFFEFQTPILTASSPEGARDYLVPSQSASRQVLRAAAGAAAIQATHHDRGLRPLFPDRAVLPRRGCARRPLARRVLPTRPGDELRHPGRCVRHGRADPARAVRGVRRRQDGDTEIPAHPLCRGDAQIRHRQAGSTQSDRDARRHRAFQGLGLQAVRRHDRHGRQHAHLGDPGARAAGAEPSATA